MKKGKKKKRVLRTILLITFGVFIGIVIYGFNASRIAGNQMPMPFGYGVSVILTGSMEPTIHTSDLVVVKQEDDYQVDDIVVFQEHYSLVIHRIIARDGDMITTKGDANNAADEPFDIENVRGRMILRIPYLGLIVKVLQTPIGIVSVIGLAAFFLFFPSRKKPEEKTEESDIEQIKEEIRRLKEESAAQTKPLQAPINKEENGQND